MNKVVQISHLDLWIWCDHRQNPSGVPPSDWQVDSKIHIEMHGAQNISNHLGKDLRDSYFLILKVAIWAKEMVQLVKCSLMRK